MLSGGAGAWARGGTFQEAWSPMLDAYDECQAQFTEDSRVLSPHAIRVTKQMQRYPGVRDYIYF